MTVSVLPDARPVTSTVFATRVGNVITQTTGIKSLSLSRYHHRHTHNSVNEAKTARVVAIRCVHGSDSSGGEHHPHLESQIELLFKHGFLGAANWRNTRLRLTTASIVKWGLQKCAPSAKIYWNLTPKALKEQRREAFCLFHASSPEH